LEPTDQVVISGIPTAHPGAKVTPNTGSIKFLTEQD